MPIVGTSDDFDHEEWSDSLKRQLPQYTDYRYCIIMPAAGRNLNIVLLQEGMDLSALQWTFSRLAEAIAHLHCKGVIQSDFKVRPQRLN